MIFIFIVRKAILIFVILSSSCCTSQIGFSTSLSYDKKLNHRRLHHNNHHVDPNNNLQRQRYYDDPNMNDDIEKERQKYIQYTSKSKEQSSFWYSSTSSLLSTNKEEDIIPYRSKLDMDGPLPFGSYRLLGNEEYESKRSCLISVALDFWNAGGSSRSSNYIDTSIAVKNIHQLIDSGFNTFQLYNPLPTSMTKLTDFGMQPSQKQIYTEQFIYNKIIQETPSTVLNQCNFATRIQIPHPDYFNSDSEDGVSYSFNEKIVRQQIGQSILRMYGHTGGCLDSLQVSFCPNSNNSNKRNNNNGHEHDFNNPTNISPYTYDILNVLRDMQREGLIRSINGLNFSTETIDQIHEELGYNVIEYNQMTCNLLNPNEYLNHMKYKRNPKMAMKQEQHQQRVLLSSPLAGGLLTNRYSNIPNSFLSRNAMPKSGYMTPSERLSWSSLSSSSSSTSNLRNRNRRGNTNNNLSWQRFQNDIMKTLSSISYKHQVSIASVVLRWSLQLDTSSSSSLGGVVVGLSLNTHLENDDRPFRRPRDLRELFSFVLDEDDMERLWNISGVNGEYSDLNSYLNDHGMDENLMENEIDFNNPKLWL